MSKICQKCNCQNDERYIFCKNCGTPLIEGELYANSPYENVGEYTEPTEQDNEVYGGAQIDGVAVNEIALFVGKNSEKIIPKFARLDGKDGKSTWCWPAAILGGLLGLMGAALWLLYRKMYKLAFCAIGISLVLTALTTVITYDVTKQVGENYKEYVGEIWYADSVEEQLQVTEDYVKENQELMADEEYVAAVRFANFISNAQCFAAAFIFGAFGIAFYKKHTTKKIKEYNAKNGMSEYYSLGLKTLGGTSGGALALGIVIAAIIPTAIKLIPFIIAFM